MLSNWLLLVFFTTKLLTWLFNLLTLNGPDEGYSRMRHLIPTILFTNWMPYQCDSNSMFAASLLFKYRDILTTSRIGSDLKPTNQRWDYHLKLEFTPISISDWSIYLNVKDERKRTWTDPKWNTLNFKHILLFKMFNNLDSHLSNGMLVDIIVMPKKNKQEKGYKNSKF